MVGRTGNFALLILLTLCPMCLGDETSLEARLAPLAKAHKGKVAIAVRHLGSGESYFLNADEPMPTASLIKLPVMIEVYQQVAEGKLKLSDPVTLRQEDKVPGSGVLTEHFTAGINFPLRDAVHLMIALSDNTATNLVLDKIGIGATAERMERWGFPNTKIHAKSFRGSTTSVFPERTKRYGLGSTTAREMIEILAKLQDGKLVSPEACKEMLALLRQCEDNAKFPRFLPESIKVAHKTGSVSNARTDAGILYLPGGPVAVCVLTDNNEDKRWVIDNAGNLFCANVAKAVYDYYSSKAVAPAGRTK
ncbi:MAG TPA: serine hydrolase [Gemmataceae bacterium]|nr:serine hydrolase [Gemmataceae bacterium]